MTPDDPPREGPRIVLHVDMDSFFAAVEVREHPDLAGKPVVVGADPKEGEGRGVVCTCSYEARNYGIHSAMPISRAYRLCPDAVFLSPRYPLYSEVSERIMAILRGYADRFQQVSIDEAYLDVSSLQNYEWAATMAARIKDDLLSEEHLSCSVGVGPGKTIAKIASDMQKPGGLVVIRPWQVPELIHPLPVTRIPGIGRKTAIALRQRGISTIGDIPRTDIQVLRDIFGKGAVQIRDLAYGIDTSEVRELSGSKSISREITFVQDCDDPGQILDTLHGMAEILVGDLEQFDLLARTVTIKIRFSDFSTITRARSLPCQTRDPRAILCTARDLAFPFLAGRKIRLVGLRLSSIALIDRNQKTIGDFLA